MATATKGYNPKFLGVDLSMPEVKASICAPLKKGTGNEIKYTHYSSYLHKDRKLAVMTAVNISGSQYNAATREESTEPWDVSEQVDSSLQLGGSFYSSDLGTFDRGHLVRRVDPCWGSDKLAAQAELDTYKWTNCTPQHKKLNQRGGVWFQLEQHVMENGVKGKLADVSVFSGPVLARDDRAFVKQYNGADVMIPVVFWKVIVWKKTDGKLYAVGFMMSQWEWIKDKLKAAPMKLTREVKPPLPDDYFENLKFSDHKTYQVPIKDIEKATGISFRWKNVAFPFQQKAFAEIKAKTIRSNTNKARAISMLPPKSRAFNGAGLKQVVREAVTEKTVELVGITL